MLAGQLTPVLVSLHLLPECRTRFKNTSDPHDSYRPSSITQYLEVLLAPYHPNWLLWLLRISKLIVSNSKVTILVMVMLIEQSCLSFNTS